MRLDRSGAELCFEGRIVAGSCDGRPEHGRCGPRVADGEREQRQARLRVLAERLGMRVRRRGGRKISSQPTELSEVVPGIGHMGEVPAFELGDGSLDLGLGRGPCAAQSNELGSVEPAIAGEVAQAWSMGAAVDLLGPFTGAAHIAEGLTEADRRAVDPSGREGIQLAGDGGGHDPVDFAQAKGDLAEAGQYGGGMEGAQRCLTRVPHPLGELRGGPEVAERRFQIALEDHGRQAGHVLQLGELRTRLLVGEQLLRPEEPSQCNREPVARYVQIGQMQGEPARLAVGAGADPQREGLFADRGTPLEVGRPHGRLGQALEIVGVERLQPRRFAVQRKRSGPVAARMGLAGLAQ